MVACVARNTLRGGAVLLSVSCLYFLSRASLTLYTNHRVFESTTLADKIKHSGAANSATGQVFEGRKVRGFSGQRLFSDPPLTKHAVSQAGGMHSCRNWSVVTTIFEPSEAVKVAAKLTGWCIVIVADTKTPADYMSRSRLDQVQGAVFLNVELQRKMIDAGDAFVRAVPWGHFSRKNIGYLYAIRNGAQFIFDFDDDNELNRRDGRTRSPIPGDSDRLIDMHAVSLESGHLLNPYPLMKPGVSEHDVWPRGFPLELIKFNFSHGVIKQSSVPFCLDRIAVVQSCANHDPDVDAIYRLTRPLPFNFKAGKGVIVPPGIYTPYNAQATVHTKRALWATFLPSTVPGRVSDIWRSYFSERLFAELDLSIAFVPPRVTQIRNAHNYLGDMNAEEDLYYKTSKLVEFLEGWRDNSKELPERMENLWIALYERGYIELGDVQLVQLWLRALVDSGYEFPTWKVPEGSSELSQALRLEKPAPIANSQPSRPQQAFDQVVLSSNSSKKRHVTLVYYTGFFGKIKEPPYYATAKGCEDTCTVTTDRSKAPQADGFVIHGRDFELPPAQYASKPWVFHCRENPAYTPIMAKQEMMKAFTYTSTARLDSDFPFPSWRELADDGHGPSTLAPVPFKERQKVPIYVANSNCEAGRTAYQKELMKHISVASMGSCLKNTPGLVGRYGKNWRVEAFEQQRKYKFTLVFMNADCDLWVDTRMLYALNAGSVPIFMGTKDVDSFLPEMEDSIIKVSDFRTPQDLAAYIAKVASNETRYNSYLDWKKRGVNYQGSKMEDVVDNMHNWYCNICDKIRHDPKAKPGRVKADICRKRRISDWLPVPMYWNSSARSKH